MNWHLIMLVAALVCFILDTLRVPVPRISLTPLGLALLTIAFAFGR